MSRVALHLVGLAPLMTIAAASAGCTLLLGYADPVAERGVAACTNEIDDDLDGMVDCDDAECARLCVREPPLPAVPAIVCPSGWTQRALEPRPVGLDALTTCDPPPDAMLLAPGPCGPMPPGVVHVLANAIVGGDGSAARPFGHLAEAIAVAGEGASILVAGDLTESAVVDRPVTLQGDCIGGSLSSATAPVLDIRASPVRVCGLVLHGSVVVEGGARLELTGAVLERTEPGGAALSLAPTARAVIAQAVIRAPEAALDVTGARITLTSTAIRARVGTVRGAVARLDADGLFVARADTTETDAPMLTFAGEATGALDHVVLEAARIDGLAVDGYGATITLTDVIVARTGDTPVLPRTLLSIAGGAVLRGSRVALLGASGTGLGLDSGSMAEMSDLVVAFDAMPVAGEDAVGARVLEDAWLTASGVLVDHAAHASIEVGSGDVVADATLEHLVIRDTSAGDAIQLGAEGMLSISDFEVSGTSGCGLELRSPDVPSPAMMVRFTHGAGAFVGNTIGVCFSQPEHHPSDFDGVLFRDNGADAQVDGAPRCFTDLSVNCGR